MDLLHTAHVPAGDGPFPAIIALHGWGASAHDLIGLAPILDAGRSVVLCPQGPIAFDTGMGAAGYGWFPLTTGSPPDPAEIQKGLDAIRAFLDRARTAYPIDPRKIVLLGFSQGGVMAYDLALRSPAEFAGLIALSSWLPAAMAESISESPDHENLPTLVIHGTRDSLISIDRGRESRDTLTRLGVPTTYREYEMAHEINQDALRQLIGWLDEKVLNPVLVA